MILLILSIFIKFHTWAGSQFKIMLFTALSVLSDYTTQGVPPT